MKKILCAWALALPLVILSGCETDFLDGRPLDQLSDQDVWSDINLARAHVNATYFWLPNGLNRDSGSMLDGGSDDATATYPWGSVAAFNRGDFTPGNAPLENNWTNYYSAIRRCNLLLENIDKVPGDETQRDQLKGEALFLRAYYYFELSRQFGGVPVITRSLSLLDNLQMPRNTYKECVDQIVKDTDEAASLLPASYTGAQVGRATQGAALALKARALLYAASPLFAVSSWQDAAAAAKKVMDLGVYSLFPDYHTLFLTDNNVEVIFDRQIDNASTLEPNLNYSHLTANPLSAGGWGETNVTQAFVDAYEMIDGAPITTSPLYDPAKPYENREPRFYATVNYNGAQWKGTTLNYWTSADGQTTGADVNTYVKWGYNIRKFLSETDNNYDVSVNYNWILMRYAEVLLNYAEAQNEAAGPDQSVYDAVDAIRVRAGLPKLLPGLTRSRMQEAIRHERRIELALEEHRFWDIRRWKIAENLVNGPAQGMSIIKNADNSFTYAPYTAETRVFIANKHYLLPIPQSERDKNKLLSQNDNY